MKEYLRFLGVVALIGFLLVFGWPLLILVGFYFGPFFWAVHGVLALVVAGFALALPVYVRRGLVRLGVSHGPVEQALNWWLWATYGLLLVQVLGWYALYRPTLDQTLMHVARLHFWLWLGPMLLALLPAYFGFRYWYRRRPQQD